MNDLGARNQEAKGNSTMYHRPSRYLPGLERLEVRDLPSAVAVQSRASEQAPLGRAEPEPDGRSARGNARQLCSAAMP